MSLPEPRPGLVIRYAYLWRSEEARGQVHGAKDRPCAIVVAIRRGSDKLTVVVAPITHAAPRDPSSAIELPAAVKARLKLDQAPSWIVTTEVNAFAWPGPDIRPVDLRDRTRGYAYGYLPAALTRAVIDGVRRHMREGRPRIVQRDN